jgi:hypothetical protein
MATRLRLVYSESGASTGSRSSENLLELPNDSRNWPSGTRRLANKLHRLRSVKPNAAAAVEMLVDDYLRRSKRR